MKKGSIEKIRKDVEEAIEDKLRLGFLEGNF